MRKLLIFFTLFLLSASLADAQRRAPRGSKTVRSPEIGQTAVVMDETISVLRNRPSLFAEPVQRMRMGRKVRIMEVRDADGVKFFRVSATPPAAGWVQADAVFGSFRPQDEERLAKLVQATKGFEQIEAAIHFFKLYPASRFKPAILLLYGDLLEDVAVKLSRDAGNRLDRRSMAASGAPLHSYYLNFVSLDRYRKLGIVFLFNPATRRFHYDGAAWKELIGKHSTASEATEARVRLDSLSAKMAAAANN